MGSETFLNGRVVLHCGDSRDVLKTIPDCSIDSIVTDPPYALVSIVKRFGAGNAAAVKVPEGGSGAYARASAGFMGKAWDTGETAFATDFWAECLRVLKPGGHVVAFSGTRTYHRMACAIEDAGFEVRDMLSWLYGSGFPKSHDVAKGIQKRRTEDDEPIRAICRALRAAMDGLDLKSRHLVEYFDGCHPRLIDHWAARNTDSQPALPTWPQWVRLKEVLRIGDDLDAEVWRLNGRKGTPGASWSDAEIVGEIDGVAPGLVGMRFDGDNTIRIASEDAVPWQGWGTALKPACEPICFGRRPLTGTVAANVLEHGTGAINIDGCRIHADDAQGGEYTVKRLKPGATLDKTGGNWRPEEGGVLFHGEMKPGRWPANIIHDGSDEVIAAFPDAPGQQGALSGNEPSPTFSGSHIYGSMARTEASTPRGDSGSAARFFYTAKADADDRLGSKHPTVKPVDLMQWLCRLVTPKGGTVLDPFAGTGTTGEAAFREGFNAVLIEREPEYQADIRRRMALCLAGPEERKRESIKAKLGDVPFEAGSLFAGIQGQEAAE